MNSSQRFSAEDRRHQILTVATKLFAAQGFKGTTTREIARQANVNEAIIFRHFPSKEELYWAVLNEQCRVGVSRETLKKQLQADRDVRDVLLEIANAIIESRQTDQTLTRLLFFSALESHELSHRFFCSVAAEFYELLADYIRVQIERGVFCQVDPMLAARGFFGMVFYHGLVQNLFGGSQFQTFDIREVSGTIVSIWLNGMLPVDSSARSRQ